MIWASVIQAGWSHTHTHSHSSRCPAPFFCLISTDLQWQAAVQPGSAATASSTPGFFFFTQMFFHYGSAEWTHTQIKSTVLEDEVGLLRIKTVTWQQSQSRGHDWRVTTVTDVTVQTAGQRTIKKYYWIFLFLLLPTDQPQRNIGSVFKNLLVLGAGAPGVKSPWDKDADFTSALNSSRPKSCRASFKPPSKYTAPGEGTRK